MSDDDKLAELKAALKNFDSSPQSKDLGESMVTDNVTWNYGIPSLTTAQLSAIDLSNLVDTIQITQLPNVYTTGSNISIGGGGGGGGSGATWSGTSMNYPGRNTLSVDGPDADIKVNGRSLMDAIDKIEQRLGLLEPNKEIEAEWEDLLELGERYRALEQRIKDKQKTFGILKTNAPVKSK